MFSIEEVVQPPTDTCPFYLCGKKYFDSERADNANEGGVTLILAHATGMHKECWEPTLRRLLPNTKIKEAWSIDAPNHGRAAVLNRRILATEFMEQCMS